MSTEMIGDRPVITVGQLRQNPTRMIREVREGAEYVLTDHGVPTATIIPFRPHRWVTFDEVRDVLAEPRDDAWIAEIEAARDQDMVDDPWERDPWLPGQPQA